MDTYFPNVQKYKRTAVANALVPRQGRTTAVPLVDNRPRTPGSVNWSESGPSQVLQAKWDTSKVSTEEAGKIDTMVSQMGTKYIIAAFKKLISTDVSLVELADLYVDQILSNPKLLEGVKQYLFHTYQDHSLHSPNDLAKGIMHLLEESKPVLEIQKVISVATKAPAELKKVMASDKTGTHALEMSPEEQLKLCLQTCKGRSPEEISQFLYTTYFYGPLNSYLRNPKGINTHASIEHLIRVAYFFLQRSFSTLMPTSVKAFRMELTADQWIPDQQKEGDTLSFPSFTSTHPELSGINSMWGDIESGAFGKVSKLALLVFHGKTKVLHPKYKYFPNEMELILPTKTTATIVKKYVIKWFKWNVSVYHLALGPQKSKSFDPSKFGLWFSSSGNVLDAPSAKVLHQSVLDEAHRFGADQAYHIGFADGTDRNCSIISIFKAAGVTISSEQAASYRHELGISPGGDIDLTSDVAKRILDLVTKKTGKKYALYDVHEQHDEHSSTQHATTKLTDNGGSNPLYIFFAGTHFSPAWRK